jgi:hypothetical protein
MKGSSLKAPGRLRLFMLAFLLPAGLKLLSFLVRIDSTEIDYNIYDLVETDLHDS